MTFTFEAMLVSFIEGSLRFMKYTVFTKHRSSVRN